MANIIYPYKNIDEMYQTLLIGSPVSQIKMLVSTPEQQPNIMIPPLVSIHPMELRFPRLTPAQRGDLYTDDGGIKEALLTLSPISVGKLIEYFQRNELRILKQQEYNQVDDEYIPDPEKELGVYMENYICSTLYCPICKAKLYKYTLSNQPVVDLYCAGNHLIKFFQVKTKRYGSRIPNEPIYSKYFHIDLINKTNYIHTGSFRYGRYTHSITLLDTNLYHALIGYILIEYNYDDLKPREITILPNKSYVIIPNIVKKNFNVNEFYSYIAVKELGNTSTIITFNQDNMECNTFSTIYPNLGNKIDITCQFDLEDIATPIEIYNRSLVATQLFRNKYLKYKNKYLNLQSNSKYLHP